MVKKLIVLFSIIIYAFVCFVVVLFLLLYENNFALTSNGIELPIGWSQGTTISGGVACQSIGNTYIGYPFIYSRGASCSAYGDISPTNNIALVLDIVTGVLITSFLALVIWLIYSKLNTRE